MLSVDILSVARLLFPHRFNGAVKEHFHILYRLECIHRLRLKKANIIFPEIKQQFSSPRFGNIQPHRTETSINVNPHTLIKT